MSEITDKWMKVMVEDGDVDDALTRWYVGSRESGRGAIHEKILGNQPALKKARPSAFFQKRSQTACPLSIVQFCAAKLVKPRVGANVLIADISQHP